MDSKSLQSQTGKVKRTGQASVKVGDCLPEASLVSTGGRIVDLRAESREQHLVLFFYPGDGTGLLFPELRGCTAEACSFRDHVRHFADAGARVYGISLQSTERQRAFADREHLSFELLSDEQRNLVSALGLPTWHGEDGMVYAARVTLLVARGGRIARVFPVVQVEGHISEVLAELEGPALYLGITQEESSLL